MGKKKKSKSVQNPTTVDPLQQQYLADLYARAQQASNAPQDPRIAGIAGEFADFQYSPEVYGGMQTTADWLQSFRNPGIDPMFAAYTQNLGQQFREQIMPAMQGQAMLTGGFGGSRAGIGNALAAQRAMQSMSEFGAQAYGGQQNRSLQAAGMYGDLSRVLGQMQSNEQTMRGTGAAMLQALPWYGLQQYRNLLGPAVLQGGGGYTKQSEGGGIGGFLGSVAGIAAPIIGGMVGGPGGAMLGSSLAGGLGGGGSAPIESGGFSLNPSGFSLLK